MMTVPDVNGGWNRAVTAGGNEHRGFGAVVEPVMMNERPLGVVFGESVGE